MTVKYLALATALCAAAAPAFAADSDPCASLAGLIHQARTDFHSLKIKKFDSGTCVFRAQEFRCTWSFPGDAFAVAEAQGARVRQCALSSPRVEAIAAKKGETGFALEDDLTFFVAGPELDDGNYKVRLRIVESMPPG